MKIEIPQGASLKGVYKITKAKLVTPEHFALNDRIVQYRNLGLPYRDLLAELHAMCKTTVETIENIIPTVGRTMIANNLTDATPDNAMRINYVGLGTGLNVPANADTQLQTETYRNAIASETNANNVAYATGFFAAAETTGAFKEAGLFCNGTASANSGVLLSRVAINVTKTNTETLTIDWTLTIN